MAAVAAAATAAATIWYHLLMCLCLCVLCVFLLCEWFCPCMKEHRQHFLCKVVNHQVNGWYRLCVLLVQMNYLQHILYWPSIFFYSVYALHYHMCIYCRWYRIQKEAWTNCTASNSRLSLPIIPILCLSLCLWLLSNHITARNERDGG